MPLQAPVSLPPDPVVGSGQGWLALAKPAGLPVFAPHGDPLGDCLLARLLARRPEQDAPAWPAGFSGGLAHRLDTASSGLVLAATAVESLKELRRRFAERRLQKRYRLLSWKDVPWDQHQLEQPIAHDRHRRSRMVVQRGRDTPHRGRWFLTWTRLWRVGRVMDPNGALTVWDVEIRTGVTHQVRVHAAMVGLALAGDHLYGGGPPTAAAVAYAAERGLPRAPFHLHHLGLSAPDLAPPRIDPPDWWPSC